MTKDAVKKLLKHIRYKSEWFFTVDDSGDALITVRVNDAYCRGRRARIYGHVCDPCRYSKKGLLWALFQEIKWLENHEAAEWFTYRGIRSFDPHR